MKDLIGLRIKIGRKFDKGKGSSRFAYPDFDAMPEEKRGGMPWQYYFDAAGTGWLYDNCCAHNEVDDYNPELGVWYGIIGVPEEFALEALTRWPNEVERLTETEFEEFYDHRCMENQSEYKYDADQLNGIRARYGDLPVADPEIIRAFTDATPDTKSAIVAGLLATDGKTLTPAEDDAASKLCDMDPCDCRALDPDDPLPGICRNKNKHFSDFKAVKNIRIK